MKRDGGDLIGSYRIQRAPFRRRLAMDTFAALPQGHYMLALLELDVTLALEAIRRLQAAGARVSLFAFAVRAIAKALAEHPELNVLRRGYSLVMFDDVDVSIPMEIETPEGRFPLDLVIRRAHAKTPAQVYGEIEGARSRYGTTGAIGAEDRRSEAQMRALELLPRSIRRRFMRWFLGRHPWMVKARVGTTLVTSVGKLATVPGFVIPPAARPHETCFALGSVLDKPAARGGQVAIRSFLSLTIAFDHDVVDGAPAARFTRRLQALIESADGLT